MAERRYRGDPTHDPGRNEMLEVFHQGDEIWIGEDITITVMSGTKGAVLLKVLTPKRKRVDIHRTKGGLDG